MRASRSLLRTLTKYNRRRLLIPKGRRTLTKYNRSRLRFPKKVNSRLQRQLFLNEIIHWHQKNRPLPRTIKVKVVRLQHVIDAFVTPQIDIVRLRLPFLRHNSNLKLVPRLSRTNKTTSWKPIRHQAHEKRSTMMKSKIETVSARDTTTCGIIYNMSVSGLF